MSDIEIKGYLPGSIGRVVELQAAYYDQVFGSGRYYEIKILKDMSDFFIRYDEKRDGFWTVCLDNRVEGSITIDSIDKNSDIVRLRWLILSSELRGRGIGKKLIATAVEFCRKQHYRQIHLWTANNLQAACHLYKQAGFKIIERHTNESSPDNRGFAIVKFILTL